MDAPQVDHYARFALPRGFEPRPELVLPETRVERPRYGVIDAHNHLGELLSANWHLRPIEELLVLLDEAGVQLLVDLDGGWGEKILDAHLAHFKEGAPDRFACFGGVDWTRWQDLRDAFPAEASSRLATQVQRGAQGLKVWKNFGLHVRDHHGRRVAADDPRLEVLWSTAADLDIPVLMHIGDLAAFFRPLDRHNERYYLLSRHPDWHVHGAGFPSHEQLLAELRSLVERHRDTVFIAAHMACDAGHLARLGELLGACPNLHVDLSAAVDELGRQPRAARRFFVEHADRILFGTDRPPELASYRLHYRFLETADEHFASPLGAKPGKSWPIHGLDLPDAVLERVYRGNAARLLGLPSGS